MTWSGIISLAASFFLILTSACSLVGVPVGPAATGQDPTAAIETRAAELVASTATAQAAFANAVASTLTALAVGLPGSASTPGTGLSPQGTLTAEASQTARGVRVSVSLQTNCRSGPGTVFEVLGVLEVGQSAEVVGRSVYNDNWIIKLPSNPSIPCWLWGQYATLEGDPTALPVYTPPSTPTAQFTRTPELGFEVVFNSIEVCPAYWGIKFKITNTGSLPWESNQVIATDLTTSETNTVTYGAFPFYDDSGCAFISMAMNLEPGEVAYTRAVEFSADPAGHPFTARIRLCSQDALVGACLDKTINFTP